MEVFSAGTIDLNQLGMFVMDATRPFASPAKLKGVRCRCGHILSRLAMVVWF
jgi:hypothetical protein